MRKQAHTLSPEDKAIIEQQAASSLRCLYSDTVREPLPDRMAELLEELKEREGVGPPERTIH